MKKIIAALLSFVMLISLFSCNLIGDITKELGKFTTPEEIPTVEPQQTTVEPQQTTVEPQQTTKEPQQTTEEPQQTTTEPQNTTPEEPKELTPPQLEGYPIAPPTFETGVLNSYEEILDIYRLAIERFDLVDDSTETIAHTLGFSNVKQVEWFETILMSSYLYYQYDGKDARDADWDRLSHFTYKETDLNGDGIKELILLTLPQDVLVIFSQIEGEPVLLGNYTPRNVCEIDDKGLLHVTEEGTRNSYSKRIYEIVNGGKRLNKIREYGVDDLLIDYPGFYMESNGKKVSISKDTFDWFEEFYCNYNTVWYSTLPLFSTTRLIRAMYQPAINGEVQIYFADTGEYIFLKDYTPARSTLPLYKRQDLKCSFGNFIADQNQMFECIIYYGDYLLLEYDHITDTVTARTLTDAEKQVARGGIYRPLPAPWRQKNIPSDEIRKSIPGYWDVYNGLIERVGGIVLHHNIDVSLQPDENGYYLVTWEKEHSPLYCSCAGCNSGILYETEAYKRMLIHAKTGEIIEISVSPQEAKEIAAAYWNTYDGYVDHAAGSTYVTRIVVEGKPEYSFGGMYYHVVWILEHYSHEAYENGGEPRYTYNFRHLYIHTQTGECYMYPSDGK